ncbi:MAG: sulfotransferase [Pseudomonadota bacterium]
MVAQIDGVYARRRWSQTPARLLAYGAFEGRPLATKGRWINPAVFSLYRLWNAAPPLKRVDAPVFIIGTGRSGTTILGVVLSAHPHAAFLNEPKALWHFAQGDEDIIGSYAGAPGRLHLSASDAGAPARRKLARVYGALLRLTGARVVIDKYPEFAFRVAYARALFPDAKFLFLVRDGRDVTASISGWSQRNGVSEAGERHDWWGRNDQKWRILVDETVGSDPAFAARAADLAAMEDHNLRAAYEWVVTMRAGLAAEAAHGDAILRVSYERLCAQPRPVLEEVSAFCGLAPSDAMLGYGEAVLSPTPHAAAPALPAWLEAPFEAVRAELGYGAPAASSSSPS